jgi:hypothetical protein
MQFLIKLIKEGNPKAFVKCFTDQPQSVKSDTKNELEEHMKSLQLDKLIILPRIADKVK